MSLRFCDLQKNIEDSNCTHAVSRPNVESQSCLLNSCNFHSSKSSQGEDMESGMWLSNRGEEKSEVAGGLPISLGAGNSLLGNSLLENSHKVGLADHLRALNYEQTNGLSPAGVCIY